MAVADGPQRARSRLAARPDRGGGAGGSAGSQGRLVERIGPARLGFRLAAGEAGVTFRATDLSLFGWPLPRALVPDIRACESEVDGWILAYADVRLPGVGRLVRCCCRLKPDGLIASCRCRFRAPEGRRRNLFLTAGRLGMTGNRPESPGDANER